MRSRRSFLADGGSLVTTGLATPAIALSVVALDFVLQRTAENFRGHLV